MKRSTLALIILTPLLIAALLLVTLVAVAALSHDAAATLMLEREMAARGISCPDTLSADLDLSAWRLTVAPVKCSKASSSFKTTSDTTITLTGLDPTSIKTDTLILDLIPQPEPADAYPSDILDGLDIKRTADRLAIAAAKLAAMDLPPIRADRVIIAVEGEPEAELTDLRVTPGSPLVINLKRAELATRKRDGTVTPRKSWLAVTSASVEATPNRVHVAGKPELKTDLTGSIRVPIQASATATHLHKGKLRWKLDLGLAW